MTQKPAPRVLPKHQKRRFPRLEIDGALPARDRTLGTVVEVRNISLGGFLALSPFPALPGEVHQFRFTLPDHRAVQVGAHAVHCRPVAAGLPFLIGWQFESDAATFPRVAQILDSVTTLPASDATDGRRRQ
jgi:hypothetical protein